MICSWNSSKFNLLCEVLFRKAGQIVKPTHGAVRFCNMACQQESDRNSSTLCPPEGVRGMKTLDVSRFSKEVTLPWLGVQDKVSSALKLIKKHLLKLNNFKPVRPVDDVDIKLTGCNPSTRKCILNPSKVNSFNDFEEHVRNELANLNITDADFHSSTVTLTYENWKTDEVLRAIIPEGEENLSSYSLIGHIVHVNLRDHLLEYKDIIGKVLLDKVQGAKTIVNKTDAIDTTYRNFKMELLCGSEDMMAKVRENHCSYEFDFSTVYWNPRLCTEHARIVEKLEAGSILYDVFAGVGPFAIPAAKKRCRVFANDLNPESYKWLQHNSKLNKVDNYLTTFNKDGKEFIKDDVRRSMLEIWGSGDCETKTMHITMNLPAIAVEFLTAFNGLFAEEELDRLNVEHFPTVHVYSFVVGDADQKDVARKLVEKHLGFPLREHLVEVCFVRNVSRKKDMFRVSFVLPRDLLCGKIKKECTVGQDHETESKEDSTEPPWKKLCVEQK